MTRLSRNLLLGVAVLAGASGLALWSGRQPPALAAILPEADGIVYADLRPVRLLFDPSRSAPTRSPDYQRFVDQTGIVPERDLDQVAFALNRRPDPAGPNGPVAFSEVFAGHFNTPRLEQYLASLAGSRETYAGHTIYVLPVEAAAALPGAPAGVARSLRVTILRSDRIAASNAPTAEQIHAIVDRDRSGPFARTAPALLSANFSRLPRLSTAWAMGQIGLLAAADPAQAGSPLSLFGLNLPMPADEPLLLSVRYVGTLHFRMEALAPSSSSALQQAGALSGTLGLVRGFAQAGGDRLEPALAAVLESLSVSQESTHPDRVLLTATLPLDMVRSLAGGGGTDAGSQPTQTER